MGDRAAVAVALALVAIFAVLFTDVVMDYRGGATFGHLWIEALAMLVAALVAGALFGNVVTARNEGRRLRAQLAATAAEAERWRAEAHDVLAGLSAAIDRQFDRWELSGAEREIGLLLLKGLSHKEVAECRGVSERTVRQQARALYRKAGLAGRAELAAFFLEDLLLPRQRPD